ncbi:MAG: hypothetical protein JSR59_20350 [Proteobacteria bacterium]|nr:hypothetical protein [Pseudomonadota bacterium]
MSRRRVAVWTAAVLLMAALAAVRFARDEARPIGSRAVPAGAASANPPIAAQGVPAEPVGSGTQASPRFPACPHESLELSSADQHEIACIGPMTATQSGSLRRYRAAAEGLSRWSLELDTAQGRVTAARIVDAGGLRFMCRPCSGMALTRPDAHGRYRIEIADAMLQGDAAAWRLHASLQAPPGAACRTTSLAVVEQDGALIDFCADGGAGFELADDGTKRYRFDDLAGQTLTVAVDAEGAVREARLGDLACRAAGCSGLEMHVAGEARTFDFSGVRFTGAPDRSATLNGQLAVPVE